jgi:hypothetical protein
MYVPAGVIIAIVILLICGFRVIDIIGIALVVLLIGFVVDNAAVFLAIAIGIAVFVAITREPTHAEKASKIATNKQAQSEADELQRFHKDEQKRQDVIARLRNKYKELRKLRYRHVRIINDIIPIIISGEKHFCITSDELARLTSHTHKQIGRTLGFLTPLKIISIDRSSGKITCRPNTSNNKLVSELYGVAKYNHVIFLHKIVFGPLLFILLLMGVMCIYCLAFL